MIDVSIIIPIYNRESTLGYCFDSINNIKYKKIEVLPYARNSVKLILQLSIIIKKMAVYRRHVI